VRVAEPVDDTSLETSLAVVSASGEIAARWTIEGDTLPTSWVGAVQAKGLLTSWNGPLASSPSLSILALLDRAGNSSAASTTPLAFTLLAPSVTSQSFDSDVVTVAYWGPSLTLRGGFTGSDPNCETGGCVQMGSFQNTVCGAPRIGIAGRLAVASAKAVHVRYRVLVNLPGVQPPGPAPTLYAPPFTVDVANPGVDAKASQPTIDSSALKGLASPMLGMSWATDWSTFDAPAPTQAAELGFTVRAGSSASSANVGACGGLEPAPLDTIVLIDSVTAE
jgi:hypothetical protein